MPLLPRTFAASALALVIAAGGPLQAWSQAPVTGEIVVNMRQADIRDVAAQVSRITGRTIVLDPGVTGTVDVVSADPLGAQGVWELFQSVLRAQGFVAVRSGQVWRVVPQAQAIQGAGRAQGEVITRLIRLRNIDPEQAVRVLRPLVAQFGSIEATTSPNAVVVTDFAENVRRIESLAQALDGGGGASFTGISLAYASAADVAQSIQGLLGGGVEGAGPRVTVDERSNMVLVRGDASDIAEARRIAEVLDVPGGATPQTRVFRLSHADAESMIEVLAGLLGGSRTGSSTATNPVAQSLAPMSEHEGGLRTAGVVLGENETQRDTDVLGRDSSVGAGWSGTERSSGLSLPDVSIQASPELNAIVMRGAPTAIATVESLLSELDVRRPQVMIEAAIVEITGEQGEQLGVQLGSGGASLTRFVESGTGGTSLSSGGLSMGAILDALGASTSGIIGPGGQIIAGGDDFSILVQALGTSSRANLLSTPSITTLDNAPAEIVVGQNVPFRTGSFTTEGNTTNPFTTIEREDVGITLRVVPRVNQGDVVRLEVSQEVSSLTDSTVTGAADLITNRRSIQTTVLADNGQTIVLGGLISDDRMQSRSQIPFLGDIPVLGALFSSNRESTTRRTLFVFLKPTILRDPADAATDAQYRYDRLRYEEGRPVPDNAPVPTDRRLPADLPAVYGAPPTPPQ